MKADEIRRFDGNQFTQWRKSIECALVEEKCLAAIKEAKETGEGEGKGRGKGKGREEGEGREEEMEALEAARCIKLRADSNPSEMHKEDVAFSEAYLGVYNSLHGRRCTSYSKNFAGVPENVVNIIHNHKDLYSQHNKTYKGDLIRLVSSDCINALKSQLDNLGLDSKQEEFKDFSKMLKVSSYDKDVVLVLLKAHPVNSLREFLSFNFVFDWEPTKVDTPLSLAEVITLFDQCNKQRADKTAEKKFLEAAEKYSLVRQDEIMSEIKPKLINQ